MLFAGNIIRHPSFEDIKYRIYGNLKNADFIMNNTFWIGVNLDFTGGMINYVLQKFKKFLKIKSR